MGGSSGGPIHKIKRFVNKQFNPSTPKSPTLPEAPETDEAEAILRRKRIEDRIRRAAFAPGRASTIATSPRGVLGPTPLTRKVLQAA